MGPRSVVVLLVLALLLTSYYWFFVRQSPDEKVGPVFPRLEFADLAEIELIPGRSSQGAGVLADPVRIRRNDAGEWWIEKPSVQAYMPRVESIGWSLVELQRISGVPSAEEASAFGAEGPEATLRFRTRGGEEHRVAVGLDHPNANLELCYARLDDHQVFLTRKSFKKNLNSRLDDLRSRALFPVNKERVIRLEVQGDDLSSKTIVRDDDGVRWRIEKPQPAPAGRDLLEAVLDELNSWQAESFVRDEPGDLPQYGLDPPALTIALIQKDGKRTALRVGKPAPEKGCVYVCWDGLPFVMTAKDEQARGLERPADEFQSRFVLQTGAGEIQEIGVPAGAPGGPPGYVLRIASERAEGKTVPGARRPARKEAPGPGRPAAWEVETSDGKSFEGDAVRIRALGESIKYLLVKRYLPRPEGPFPAETGLSAPAARVDVRMEAGARYSLAFGKPPDGSEEAAQGIYYVAVEGETFLCQVATSLPRELARSAAWFRNRRISKLDPENLREFAIIRREGSLQQVWSLGKAAEIWNLWNEGDLILKPGKSLDDGLVRKVASTLGREVFQVEEWRPEEKDLSGKEIDRERFRIRIELTTTTGQLQGFRSLWIGQEESLEGVHVGWWARVDDPEVADLPFILERSLGRPILDLVDHLQEITEAAQK